MPPDPPVFPIWIWIWVPISRLTGRPGWGGGGGEHDGVPNESVDRPAIPCETHTPGPRQILPSAQGTGQCQGHALLGTQSAPGSTPRPHPGGPEACPTTAAAPCTALPSTPRAAPTTAPTHPCHSPCHCPSHPIPLPMPQHPPLPLALPRRWRDGGREKRREGGLAPPTTRSIGRPHHMRCTPQVPDGPTPRVPWAMPAPGSAGPRPTHGAGRSAPRPRPKPSMGLLLLPGRRRPRRRACLHKEDQG